MQKDNPTAVLIRFIKALRIPVTRQSISDELEKHPDHDSMLGFSDVLQNFGISAGVYKVPYAQLDEAPLPFVCQLTDKNKTFVVVSRLDDKKVALSNEKWNNKLFTYERFRVMYAGAVLAAESIEGAGEPGYEHKFKQERLETMRLPVALAGLAIILLAAFLHYSRYVNNLNAPVLLLTLFKTAGLVTTILLLVQSIDANNPLVQKLCGSDDGKDCNAILSSKAAKVPVISGLELSWSEMGFFYFAGTWLLLLFFSGDKAIMQALAILNLLALPYTVYSVYYQWRVAKQWCVFCCAVQALLWLEFFAFLPYLIQPLQALSLYEWAIFAAGMAAPVFIWMFGKPYFMQLAGIPELGAHLRHFKNNKDLFDAALKSQPRFAAPGEDRTIVLGHPDAKNVLTMVSNPYCQPCAIAHTQIEDALNNDSDMQVRILFTGNNTDSRDKRSEVHRHLMALNALPDKSIVRRALHDWYAQKQKNYDEWAKAYPVDIGTGHNAKLEKQKQWVDMAGINATPTLLLNGYKLPMVYQLKELKYMLG